MEVLYMSSLDLFYSIVERILSFLYNDLIVVNGLSFLQLFFSVSIFLSLISFLFSVSSTRFSNDVEKK